MLKIKWFEMKRNMNALQQASLIKSMLMVILLPGIGSFNLLSGQGINEQVTVVAAYEPSVPDVNKININPSASETEVKLPVMSYSVTPVQMETKLSPESIPAVRLVGEPQKKLLRNYARLGFGNYTTPYAEFWANSLRSKSYQLGLHFKHLSSSGEIKDYAESGNSVNLIQLQGRKFLGQHTLSAGLGFRRNAVHHYGFKPAESEGFFPDDMLKQRFNRLNASVAIRSDYADEDKLNHQFSLGFRNIADKFKTRETAFSLQGAADKRFELFDFTDFQQLGLETSVDFTGYKDSTLKQSSTLVSVRPFIATGFNEYTFKLGLNFTFQGDSVSKAYLFPFAEARLRVVEDALGIYAGITGGLQRRGFDALAEQNPFIQSVLPLQYTREKFAFYAGASARAGRHINLYASFRTGVIEHEAFFVNDFSQAPFNRFVPVYDDANMLAGRFEAEYHTAERLKIKAFAAFEKWSMQQELHPWHKPVTTFGAEAFYNIGNKIMARASFTASGKQYARLEDPDGEERAYRIKGYTDVSLGIEYRYTRQLSAFLNLNNVTGVRAYKWYNYPGYRFNLLGGIAYSF
jgi:outer membrane receptor protein involved in Fe transport